MTVGEHVCVPKKTNTDYTEVPLRKANILAQQIEITYPQSGSGLIPYFFQRNIVHAMPTPNILEVQSSHSPSSAEALNRVSRNFI